jgi:hypothetical protein
MAARPREGARMTRVLRTWKVRATDRGVELTINGEAYVVGATAEPIAFELMRAAGHDTGCRTVTHRVNDDYCPECRRAGAHLGA